MDQAGPPDSLSDRAQTNVRLYAQLHDMGYDMDDSLALRDAYGLAMRLFSAHWRPEGRPFVCHLVGVASILALLRADRASLVAGLLHSAYSHGDFGHGAGFPGASAREELVRVVGPEAEQLVSAYTRLAWRPAAVAQWLADPETLDHDTRRIVVIRLANALEDALDGGLALAARPARKDGTIAVVDMAQLARVLGYPQLAAALEQTAEQRVNLPQLARLQGAQRASYVVGPASWRRKWLPRLARLASRIT